ncbi:hypothetical protein BHF71_10385 [Vulcanibacillus modesticaldus]|uniref:Maltodextrin-binding protein n=1 Tax=Vulcanibacillus modesticaldus TaxID=337097 RepID=A0A1D2YTJ9_9BACI|nr:extracellular solute-binding protein [Vulcanibacillus modesticaldus]OEF98981.1 hypothetical protein BHF71_10385 [Vulcanibacillus modesticaldus]
MKKLLFIFSIFALVFLLSACSSETSEEPKQEVIDEQVTISFWHTMNDEETKTLEAIVEEFENANPNIKVNMENVPFSEAQNKFKTAAQAGNAPDVFRSEIAWTPEFAALGYLMPLDNYFKDQDDFLAAPLNYSKWNGKTWSVPQVTDALALLYNKKMLADAGYDKAPETWDEFVKVAQDLTKGGKYGFYYRQSDAYWFQPFMWSFGGGLIDEDDLEIHINDPGSVKALEFILKLRDEYKVFKNDKDFSNDYTNAMETFKAGDVAMILNGPWSTSDILSGSAFEDPNNLGIAPIPKGPEGLTGSPVGGHGYVIYAGTKNADASYKFIEFLSSKENQAKFAVNNGLLPTRKSAYELDEVKNNRIISDYKLVIERATNRPVIPEGGQIYTDFTPEIQAVFQGKKSPQEALDAVAKAWAELLGK